MSNTKQSPKTPSDIYKLLLSYLGWYLFSLFILSFLILGFCLTFNINLTHYQVLLVALWFFTLRAVYFTLSFRILSLQLILNAILAIIFSKIL